MKKFICLILVGFLGSLLSNVTAATKDYRPDKVLVIDDNDVSKNYYVADLGTVLTEACIITNHDFIAPDIMSIRENELPYCDHYLLKLPVHYLLPEKSKWLTGHERICSY